MFNLGLPEILLIAIVAILAIGPKELPTVMAHLGRIVKRLAYMRYAFTQQFDSFIRESGLEEVKNNVNFEAPSPDLVSPEQAHQKALEAFQLEEDEVKPKSKPKPKTKPKTKEKAAPKKTTTQKTPTTKRASAAKSTKTKKTKKAKDASS